MSRTRRCHSIIRSSFTWYVGQGSSNIRFDIVFLVLTNSVSERWNESLDELSPVAFCSCPQILELFVHDDRMTVSRSRNESSELIAYRIQSITHRNDFSSFRVTYRCFSNVSCAVRYIFRV